MRAGTANDAQTRAVREERLRLLAAKVRGLKHLEDRPYRGRVGVMTEIDEMDDGLDGFNMSWFGCRLQSCDTAGCLGGWTVALWPEEARAVAERICTTDISSVAGELLYLDAYEHAALFCPAAPKGLQNITPEQAAQVAEALADGEDPGIAWEIATGVEQGGRNDWR